MALLQEYIECMKKGDPVCLADLFTDDGVLHDSSLIKIGQDTLHLEGKMAVEMIFHYKFGFNGGPFPIHSVYYHGDDQVWYYVEYGGVILPVTALLTEVSEGGKIARINIYPL